jgi:putative transposase
MIDVEHQEFSITEQCALLKVSRSTVYYKPKPTPLEDFSLMRVMDDLYLKWPFYGSRRMVEQLRRDGYNVNRKRIRRLMKQMGLSAIYPKPRTSASNPNHKIYSYLLNNVDVTTANQVWCADITYIPMARGFVYLVAIMDWFSRKILAWKLSITMETNFCVEALQEAIQKHGTPEIFNTDQGVQFTAEAFTSVLKNNKIQISMDGRGRYLDNIFIERLWRSLKYEEIFLRAYEKVEEARPRYRFMA